MSKDLLVVIDMQNDFVTDALGTAEAQAMLPALSELAHSWQGPVVFTRDTHTSDYLHTQEGRNLPVPHCIQGTRGWQIVDELQDLAANAPIFDKPTFGSTRLAHYLATEKPDSITFCGVCTGICVISNVLLVKAALPETPIRVAASCCACVTPQSHQTALDAMKLCQIEMV